MRSNLAVVICAISLAWCCFGRRTRPTAEAVRGSRMLLARSLGRDHLSERLKALALETLHFHRLDRIEIGGAGVDLDALDYHRQLETLNTCSLLHDVGAGQVVAALLQDVHQKGRH